MSHLTWNGIAAALSASLAVVAAPMTSSAATVEVAITNDPNVRAGEPEIAVNPKNPNNIAYFVMTMKYNYNQQVGEKWAEKSFIDCYLAVSFDRGKSWRRVDNPFLMSRMTICGDPMIAFGPDGTLYAAADGMGVDPGRKDPDPLGEVVFSRSADGGRTWTNPVITGTPIDRPWMSVDQSDGAIYLTSSCASPDRSYCEPNTRYILSSRDKGATWTPRVPIDSPAYLAGRGGSISAAHGVLAVTYVSARIEGRTCPCLVFATTRDTGRTWDRQVVPSSEAVGGQAQIAADPSRAGRYVNSALAPQRNRFLLFGTDDGGKTWIKPQTVTNDPKRAQFKQWVGYSPSGVFGIVWRSSAATPEEMGVPAARTPGTPAPKTFPYDVWAAVSSDGGKTVSKPLKISSQMSPAPDPAQQATDDVSFITLDRTHAHFGWGDWRSGELQGWYARTPLADFGR